MSVKIVEDDKLAAIGDAIRTKAGTSALLTLDAMPQAIADIQSGGGSGFDTSVCKGISFYGGLITGAPDLSTLDTSPLTQMNLMFYECSGLTALDLTGFDTSNVTNFNQMFYYCGGLTSLDLSSFNTAKAIQLTEMFRYCSALKSVNLWNFETNNANCRRMFEYCTALTDVIWSQKPSVQGLNFQPSMIGITSSMKFYVPDDLLTSYQSNTNWSYVSTQIYPISQLPSDVAALYGIGA